MIIPSPHRDCPSFQENEDGDQDRIRKLYNKGYSAQKIHYSDMANTPCHSDDDPCKYMSQLKQLESKTSSIDVLIGHHSHSYRELYVQDRIVIFDEFNEGAFSSRYPNPDSNITDDPRKTIPDLLDNLNKHADGFPSKHFKDFTDLLVNREDPDKREKAVDWIVSTGASRSVAEDLEYLKVNDYRYNNTHLEALFLTLSLLCMRRVGEEIEMAPHPDDNYYDMWKEAGLNPSLRVVHDRNTGQMHVWRPPDLSNADQVIGLDGTPTLKLWNMLLPPNDDTEFDHRKVIDRSDFMNYIRSGLNMSLVQTGDGAHNYAGGRTSDKDEDRFAAIQAIENQSFPLISTKKALNQYAHDDLLDGYVESINDEDEDTYQFEWLRALNFGSLRSSNVFENDSLGVVSGTPYPGDDIIKAWVGLCGEKATVEDDGLDKTFQPFGEDIFEHFAHHQVIQGILRFGRNESITEDGGATVYVNTQLLPPWFSIENELDIHTDSKELAVVHQLKNRFESTDRQSEQLFSVQKMVDEFQGLSGDSKNSISESQARKVLKKLVNRGMASVKKDHGKGGADLYKWNEETIVRNTIGREMVVNRNTVYIFE